MVQASCSAFVLIDRWWNRIRYSSFHVNVHARHGCPVSASIQERDNPMSSRSTRGDHGSFSECYGTTVSRGVGSRTCKLRGAFDGLGCRDGWCLRVEWDRTCQRGKSRPHAQHSCYRGLLHVDPLFAERGAKASAVAQRQTIALELVVGILQFLYGRI